MKRFPFTFVTVLLLAPALSAQTTAMDSTEATAGGNAFTNDSELILDDSVESLLPEQAEKTVTPAARRDSQPSARSDVPAGTQTDAPGAGLGLPRGESPAPKVTDGELIPDSEGLDFPGKAITADPGTPPAEDKTATDATPALQETNAALTPAAAPVPGADGSAEAGTSSAVTQAAAVKPSQVEAGKEHAVNFARNLKEYRSPKLAMLMSLIIPGAGQIYARSNLWAAAFGIIEAAVVGTGFALSAKAKKIKKQARDFADRHCDTSRVRGYIDSLKQFLPTMFSPDTDAVHKADSVFNEVIFLSDEDLSFFSDARRKNDAYYGYLDRGASSPFIRGWDDVEPVFTSSGFQYDAARFGVYQGDTSTTAYLVFLQSDPARTMYGISANQEHYSSLLRDSRNWAGYSRSTFLSLLINHIAASVTAGIAAKKHNDALLGRESVWRRIDFEQQFVFTGTETAPGYVLKVSF